jgi:hypothetical protein
VKARLGCYIKTGINYGRRNDLEGADSHLLNVNVKAEQDLRIINMYTTFNPLNQDGAMVRINHQLNLVINAFTKNAILLNDFKLDWSKKGLRDYAFNCYFEDIDIMLDQLNLIQLANFPTWSRFIRVTHEINFGPCLH